MRTSSGRSLASAVATCAASPLSLLRSTSPAVRCCSRCVWELIAACRLDEGKPRSVVTYVSCQKSNAVNATCVFRSHTHT